LFNPTEQARLDALLALDILDTEPERGFDALTELAASTLGTRMAAVSLIDTDRQWFKSRVNIPVSETSRDVAFCAHAIAGDELFHIPDATVDPRFADNPLVTGEPHIRSYAGMPLRAPSGHRIGTLCVIHDQPKEMSESDRRNLQWLAVLAEERIADRRNRKETEISNRILDSLTEVQTRFINSEGNSRQAFDALLERVLELTLSEYGFIGEILDDGDSPYLKTWAITNIAWNDETRVFYADNAPQGLEFRNLSTLFGYTIRTGERILTANAAEHEEAGGVPPGHPDLVTYAGIPLYSHGEFVAMLGVANRPGGYSDALIERLAPLLQSIGNLIHAFRVSRSRDKVLRRLEAVTELGEIGSWEVDVKARRTDWDPITRAIHEVDKHYQPDLESAIDFYAPEARTIITEAIETATAEKTSWDLELPFITAKGNRRWVRAAGKPIEERGEVVRLLGSFQDVTERRAREEELKEVSTRLAMSLESSAIGAWEYCLSTKSHTWDETTRRLYGYSADAAIPQADEFEARIHPDDREKVLAQIQTAFETGGSISSEFRFDGFDGKLRHLRSYGLLMQRDDGPPILTGFNYDVTADVEVAQELDSRREEAEAANLAKSQFLANMSHEIRTPLNGVMGMTQLLRETDLDEAQESYINTLRASGQALLDLIEDVLDIAKIESGTIELRQDAFEMDALVADALAIIKPSAEAKSLTLALVRDPDVPARVIGDEKRVRQVLINMLGNAAKFTEAGTISVRLSCGDGNRIRITVVDTGPGIPHDQLHCVFDRFAQVDDSATRQHGGTGLGLAICRELVELAGGDVGVDSALGAGSSFWFELPLPKAGSEPAPAARAAQTYRETRHEPAFGRVLIVDDVATNQLVAAAFVRQAGYEVTLADNGQAALDRLAEDRFDVVLMDMQMPVMSGEEAIQRIREMDTDYRNVTIFVLTADATFGARERYLECGADGYLSKPLNRDEVIGALHALSLDATG